MELTTGALFVLAEYLMAPGMPLLGGLIFVSVLLILAAIDALAKVAVDVNSTVENIGARRLQTVLERVIDEISFTATDRGGESVTIDATYVEARIGDLAKNADLSRFIL